MSHQTKAELAIKLGIDMAQSKGYWDANFQYFELSSSVLKWKQRDQCGDCVNIDDLPPWRGKVWPCLDHML